MIIFREDFADIKKVDIPPIISVIKHPKRAYTVKTTFTGGFSIEEIHGRKSH